MNKATEKCIGCKRLIKNVGDFNYYCTTDIVCENYDEFRDNIHNPQHYLSVGKIEPIEFIMDKELNFCLGNVVKYIVRAGRKEGSSELEDLHKAQEYLRRHIEFKEKINEQ